MLYCQRQNKYLTFLLPTGSYTDSPGISTVRNHVAEYISERDGYPASPDDIFVGTGASSCIKVSSSIDCVLMCLCPYVSVSLLSVCLLYTELTNYLD